MVVVGLALAAPIGTSAQQTAVELQARLDSLRPLRAETRAAAEAREARDNEARRASAAAIATVDTIRVGIVTIVTPVEQVETARELFTEVWEADYAFVRSSPSLSDARFTFQWASESVPIHIEEHGRAIHFDRDWIPRANVKRAIRDAIGITLNFDLRAFDTEISHWVSGNPLQTRDMEQVYRAVATSPSRVTRACLEGDLDGCASALGLGRDRSQLRSALRGLRDPEAVDRWVDDQRERLLEWYTEDERRELAATRLQNRYSRIGTWSGPEWGECVEQGVIAVCDRILADTWQDWAPLSGSVRESVLAFAIRQGGDGVWERLLESPEMTPDEALEYAASMPLEELLRGWHVELLASRPNTFDNLAPKSGLTFLWVLVFSGFAMRSTRWRLG